MKFIEKQIKRVTLKSPIIIQGLPGIGNVGRLAVDYLIDETDAVLFKEIYSSSFPNSVFVNADSTVSLPSLRFYHRRIKSKDYVFIMGDAQPTEEEKSFELSEKIVETAKKWGARLIITIGGIGLRAEPSKPKVHAVVSDPKMKKQLKNYVILDGDKTVGFIVGANGLVVGLASLAKLKAIALLSETFAHPEHFGINAALSALEVVNSITGLNIELNRLKSEVKSLKRRAKKVAQMEESSPEEMSYIG
ncbi:hypothetical protein DRN75_03375 [Nanoarchaeota archaeon]|nr:MAG: hypothetical protein DRN75_03375 [Nanoarchaeota archaeon]